MANSPPKRRGGGAGAHRERPVPTLPGLRVSLHRGAGERGSETRSAGRGRAPRGPWPRPPATPASGERVVVAW